MMQTKSRRTTAFTSTIVLLSALSMNAAAQDSPNSDAEEASASPGAGSTSSSDGSSTMLPRSLGECAGAELRVISVEAPFGEPLVPWDELVANDGTLGLAEVEYLLPAGATNAFVSFSAPDAAGLSLQGSEIVGANPEASDVNVDVHYSVDTIQGTITDPAVGARTTTDVDLNIVDVESYLGMWAGWGVDPADHVDPPYAHGDQMRIFLTFELDGAIYSWSSRSSSSDCSVR